MYYLNNSLTFTLTKLFLRTKFICIIWTDGKQVCLYPRSWGLSLFVLFEPHNSFEHIHKSSWGLSLFVLFELWLLPATDQMQFLRTKFICIIWTKPCSSCTHFSSWGLSLFVLFEHSRHGLDDWCCSWGLSLFVLFELSSNEDWQSRSSWGLSLFVLFEP